MFLKYLPTLLGTALLMATGYWVINHTAPQNVTFGRAEIGVPVSPPSVVEGTLYHSFLAARFAADDAPRLRVFSPDELQGTITAVRDTNGQYIPVEVSYTLHYRHDDKISCDSAKRLIPAAYGEAGADRQTLFVDGCRQTQADAMLRQPVLLTVSQRIRDDRLVAILTPSNA